MYWSAPSKSIKLYGEFAPAPKNDWSGRIELYTKSSVVMLVIVPSLSLDDTS